MVAAIAWVWSYMWASPYTNPPPGQPRVLLSIQVSGPRCGECPEEITQIWKPGSGYCVAVAPVLPPIKPWSDERRLAYRRKRLLARLNKKYPLLVEIFYEEAISKKPDYYGLEVNNHASE